MTVVWRIEIRVCFRLKIADRSFNESVELHHLASLSTRVIRNSHRKQWHCWSLLLVKSMINCVDFCRNTSIWFRNKTNWNEKRSFVVEQFSSKDLGIYQQTAKQVCFSLPLFSLSFFLSFFSVLWLQDYYQLLGTEIVSKKEKKKQLYLGVPLTGLYPFSTLIQWLSVNANTKEGLVKKTITLSFVIN